jgi:hypothetical protein
MLNTGDSAEDLADFDALFVPVHTGKELHVIVKGKLNCDGPG